MSVRLRLPEAFLRRLGEEPEWLTELREEALARSEELPLPVLEKIRLESWRLDAADPTAEAPPPVIQPTLDDAGIAVHHGLELARRLPEEWAARGVRLGTLAEFVRRDPEFVRQHLFRPPVPVPEDRLTALHRAFHDGGVVLHVPRRVEVSVPVELWTTVAGDAFPHTLIVVEEGATVDVVETLTSPEDARGTVNGMVELYVGPGARVRYYGIQTVSPGGMRLALPRQAFVDRDARLEWYLVEVGGLRNVAHHTTHLIGPGASADSTAVFLGGGRQDMHLATSMLHESHHTESNMDTRGVLRDRAHVAYIGTTDIRRESPGCQSWQKESTLLLSEDCRADLIPALWIYNHDVSRAGHAAAAGRVNEEQVYYLMSRGIPRKEAELLIVLGYLRPLVERIPLPRVVERLLALVEKKVRA